jgi:hypothetical protein
VFVYVARSYTTTVVGRRWEQVACEKCQTTFHYELVRVGVGSGSAPYFIGQDSARDRSAGAAHKDVNKKLEREAELVPCPKCHRVNQSLIRRYRRGIRRYRRGILRVWPWASLLLWIIDGAIIFGIWDDARMDWSQLTPAQWQTVWITIAACLAIPLISFAARAWRRTRGEPQRDLA